MVTGTVWWISKITKFTDGDTIRVMRERTVDIVDELVLIMRDRDPAGIAIRLVNLDTPERGQPGYKEATADLQAWLSRYIWPDGRGTDLSIITYPGGGFDRLLGDVIAPDGDTASQYMIRERGWLPYVEGK